MSQSLVIEWKKNKKESKLVGVDLVELEKYGVSIEDYLSNKKVIIEPKQIFQGDLVTIKIISSDDYLLESPYFGLSNKSIETNDDEITEILELSGSEFVNADFPINTVISAYSECDLVDATKESIVIVAGTNLSSFISVKNGRLKFNIGIEKIYGSIKVSYQSFDYQRWQHEGFDNVGQVILFAKKIADLIPENVTFSINQRLEVVGKNSLSIERAEVSRTYFGLTDVYVKIRVFPASDISVKVDKGRIERKTNTSQLIENEQINLDGSGFVSLKFDLNKLLKITGFFKNSKGESASTAFYLKDGGLSYKAGVFGSAFVHYETSAAEYNYFAQVTFLPFGGTLTEIGYVMAESNGQFASFKIPAHEYNFRDKKEVLSVVYEIISNGKETFELPPGADDNEASYPSTSFPDEELMKFTGQARTERVAEVVYFDGLSISYTEGDTRTMKPFSGRDNPDRVYRVIKSSDSNMAGDAVDQVNQAEIALKAKWKVK